MRILLTNDDGMNASQLVPLARWLRRYGEVFVAVPKYEQSGKSLGIEIHKPFEVTEAVLAPDVTAAVIDSTPADCVRFAVLGLEKSFDLVISGINIGFNIGVDIQYSGTVGAVLEAATLGLKALAISTPPPYYNHALDHLEPVFDYIFQKNLLELHYAYNVNIPPDPKDILITRQGGPYFSDSFEKVGENLYAAKVKNIYTPCSDTVFDTDAVMNGYISIMPLTADKTELSVYRKLTENPL